MHKKHFIHSNQLIHHTQCVDNLNRYNTLQTHPYQARKQTQVSHTMPHRHRRFIIGFLMGLMCLGASALTPAHATDGLSWELAGQEVRYRIQTDIRSPQSFLFQAKKNVAFQSNHIQTALVTQCGEVEVRGKKAFALQCTVEDISLRAGFTSGHGTHVEDILKEWETTLKGAQVQLVITRNGQVRYAELDNGEMRNRRENEIHGAMEMILARAYTGLDAQLPKAGTDEGLGQWSIKHANTMGTPSASGVMGSVRGASTFVQRDDETVLIHSTARGMRMTGPTNVGLVGIAYEMKLNDNVIFDNVRQQMSARSYYVEGTPTASNDLNASFTYIQQGLVERLDDASPVALGQTSGYPTVAWLPRVTSADMPILASVD
jgi:hypothetical protein